MPVPVSYPGVYVEEIPSGVRTITGVATSIAAFVDFFPQGPTGPSNAVQIFSYADFERQFGGLSANSEASYAIQQFFLNGGSTAYVIRVVSGAAAAGTVDIDNSGTKTVLTATALSQGALGNNLRIDIDYGTSDPSKLFNLTVTQYDSAAGTQVLATEKYLALTIDPTAANDAAKTVNAGSQLISLTETAGSPNMPLPSGTASGALPASFPTIAKGDAMDVFLGDKNNLAGAKIGSITMPDPPPKDYASLAAIMQSQLRKITSGAKFVVPGATVSVVGGPTASSYLVAKPNLGEPTSFLNFADTTGSIDTALKFVAGAQQYPLASGNDGDTDWTSAAVAMTNAIIGDENQKTGMYALLDVDEFNILCIPATMNMPDSEAFQVASDATALCTQRRAVYILDTPQVDDTTRDTPTGIMKWLGTYDSLRSDYAALYFPRVDIADPLNNYALRKVAPSGTMAGIYARTDSARGVWKAPAGTDASLTGVQKLEYNLTDGENGVLNPLAINCLRNFPVYGPVAWGARTMKGADVLADDYKYIPVRRLALYIEESLFRGTKWVVFEPNASPLWAQVRLNVGSFMQNLFRQGAFFGTTPQEAYFVTCDATNNPQNTIDLGIINIAVGFAPLKPAEFVIIQIQQMAGQIAS
jgi:uncharacterized protein